MLRPFTRTPPPRHERSQFGMLGVHPHSHVERHPQLGRRTLRPDAVRGAVGDEQSAAQVGPDVHERQVEEPVRDDELVVRLGAVDRVVEVDPLPAELDRVPGRPADAVHPDEVPDALGRERRELDVHFLRDRSSPGRNRRAGGLGHRHRRPDERGNGRSERWTDRPGQTAESRSCDMPPPWFARAPGVTRTFCRASRVIRFSLPQRIHQIRADPPLRFVALT